jgi:hypothetical protein
VGAGDRLQVVFFVEVAYRFGAHRTRRHWRVDAAPQHHAQVFQALARFRKRFRLGGVGIHDQVQLARQVVDHRQFLGHHQLYVGQAEVVLRRGGGQLALDVAHRVVAEIAGQAAAKPRQAGTERDLEPGLEGFDEVERVAVVRLDHAAVFDDLGARAEGAQQGIGRQADKGVAAETLAADHRFEQEGVLAGVLGLGQFQVQRERGFEVGKRFRNERNAVVALVGEGLEFEFGHAFSPGRRKMDSGGFQKTWRCPKEEGSRQQSMRVTWPRIASVAKARPQSSRFG